MRQNFATNTPWEPIVGYSRAVRVGNQIFVSGTTAPGPRDAYGQARETLQKIGTALERAGASFEHVVRTRMFVTDISQWREIARAHSEVFGRILPATTMVEVRRFVSDEILVEIEADAVVV